jgi:hypothetical protein
MSVGVKPLKARAFHVKRWAWIGGGRVSRESHTGEKLTRHRFRETLPASTCRSWAMKTYIKPTFVRREELIRITSGCMVIVSFDTNDPE